MRNYFFSIAVAAVTAVFCSSAFALTIPASEDASSVGGRITLSASNAGLLPVDKNRKAFIYFSLEEVPVDATVRFARLRLYTTNVRAKGEGIAIHRVEGEWNESAVSLEPTIAQTPLAVVEPAKLGSRRFVTVDVTSTVQDWVSSRNGVNEGFAILPITSGTASASAVLNISSKDGPVNGMPAQLEIELDPRTSVSQTPLISNVDDFNRLLKSSMSTEFLRTIKSSIVGFLSPVIASQPAVTVAGTSNFLTVGATTDIGTLSYQWLRNGTLVAGGTSASLALSAPYEGSYSVTVNNGSVPATSRTVSIAPNLEWYYLETYSWSTLAGSSTVGANDGNGTAALFGSPRGVAVDSAGNVFVADLANHTIRKVTPDGTVSTLAGVPGSQGSTNGVGSAARFNYPIGVAADGAGNVFVADSSNNRIRKISPDGTVSTFAGSVASGATDGFGTAASFFLPGGVAADSAGNIYVADTSNHLIRKISAAGGVTTVAGSARVSGSTDGSGAEAKFNSPYGIAVAASGDVFVSDSSNHTVRRISPSGVVTTIAGLARTPGSVDGSGSDARFNTPRGIGTDDQGNVFVTDGLNYTVRKIDQTGRVTTLAGSAGFQGYQNGAGNSARFASIHWGLAVTQSGTVFVGGNQRIRKVSPTGDVTPLAGASPGATDGMAAAARFARPSGIVADRKGNVFIADELNHTIRKMSADGVVSTFAGSPLASGTADGRGGNARFFEPRNLALDGLGNLYVADAGNHSIRKITQEGMVTTLAGMHGTAGQSDGVGAAARFNAPIGVAADATGNVYVADTGNHTIRKISVNGAVTTLAGSIGFTGSTDGTGNSARFNSPNGLVAASDGSLYVADTNNSLIRKVSPEGVVTTLAGRFSGTRIVGKQDGVNGVGAWLTTPLAIAIDGDGSVFFTESNSNTIRRVTSAGLVSTVGGFWVSGSESYGAKDGVMTAARFARPAAITVGLNNKIYVVDIDSNTVRLGVRIE